MPFGELVLTFKATPTRADLDVLGAAVSPLGFVLSHFDGSREVKVLGEREALRAFAEAFYARGWEGQ